MTVAGDDAVDGMEVFADVGGRRGGRNGDEAAFEGGTEVDKEFVFELLRKSAEFDAAMRGRRGAPGGRALPASIMEWLCWRGSGLFLIFDFWFLIWGVRLSRRDADRSTRDGCAPRRFGGGFLAEVFAAVGHDGFDVGSHLGLVEGFGVSLGGELLAGEGGETARTE
jgi:hypothetical protein